jgi:hypothetical protein
VQFSRKRINVSAKVVKQLTKQKYLQVYKAKAVMFENIVAKDVAKKFC